MFTGKLAIYMFIYTLFVLLSVTSKSYGEDVVDSDTDDYKLVLENHYSSQLSLVNKHGVVVTAIKLTNDNRSTLIPLITKDQLTGCVKPYIVNQKSDKELLFLYCFSGNIVYLKTLFEVKDNKYIKLEVGKP